MLKLRRILFILFTLIYLICCPLIILYALGINLSPRSDQNLVKTGIIFLSTFPGGGTIYLDNLRYPEKTTTIIRNLPPREYSVKIALKDYLPWEKIVPVKAEKATLFSNILLIPQTWKTKPVTLFPTEDIIPLNNSLFLIKKGPLVQDLFLFRASESLPGILLDLEATDKKSPLSPLFSQDIIYNQAKVISYFTVPGSPLVLLGINLKGVEKFLWIDLRQKPPQIDDITDLIIKKPKKIYWERHDNKNIFTYQDNTLTRIGTSTKAIYPNLAERIRGWGLYNQKVYTISQDHIVKRTGHDGKDPEFIFQDRSFVLSHFGKNTEYQISIFADDLILFLGEHGELLCNRFPFELIKENVKDFVFDEDSKRLLVWTNQALGIIDFSLATQEDHLFGPGPRLRWLTTTVQNIDQAFWVNQASYILYRDQNKIVLMETEKFNNPTAYEVLNVKRNSSIMYSEPTGKLYYLDPQTQQLSELTIVPGKDPFAFTNNRKKKKRDNAQ